MSELSSTGQRFITLTPSASHDVEASPRLAERWYCSQRAQCDVEEGAWILNVPLVVGEFLNRARSLFADRTAVICGDVRLDYRTFADRVNRWSAALFSLGVRKGHIVAYVSLNCHRLLEGYYAVPQIGAILLPVNVRLRPKDIAVILGHAEASAIVVDRSLAGLVASVVQDLPQIPQVILMGEDPASACPLAGADYETILATPSADIPSVEIAEDDVAEIFYTSGTTDQPKGVMLTHRNLYLHALFTLLPLPMEENAAQLHAVPLYHVNGWGTPHTVTLCGGKHVMLGKFDPRQFLELIDRERVTQVLAVPAVARAVLEMSAFQDYDLSSLRHLILGGDVAQTSLIQALDARLPNCEVTCGYGLTETSPVLAVARIKPGLHVDSQRSAELRSTAGYALPGVRLEVLDDQGEPLSHNGASVGEICVQANTVMKGYWKQPKLTAECMLGGWFHTGDMGTIDEQGYVRIVDRKKDVIKTAGEIVISTEVENVIQEHPNVAECSVIGLPDAHRGEVPVGIVVAKPDCKLRESDLLKHCRERLASFKVPRRIIFMDALPRGTTGKPLKRQLRRMFSAAAV